MYCCYCVFSLIGGLIIADIYEAIKSTFSKLSSTVLNSVTPVHSFALMKCMGSDLNMAVLGLSYGLTIVAYFLRSNFCAC